MQNLSVVPWASLLIARDALKRPRIRGRLGTINQGVAERDLIDPSSTPHTSVSAITRIHGRRCVILSRNAWKRGS